MECPIQTSQITNRKLASVQVINSIEPIQKIDRFESVGILGYKAAAPINQFKIGDKVVYFEVDSILPSNVEWSQFLKPNYHVTIAKFSKFVSFGVVLPWTIISPDVKESDYNVGTDLTNILGVTKYLNKEERKELTEGNEVNGTVNKLFPVEYIEKSDETRLQSKLEYIELFQNKSFYSTWKYDGTSSTYLVDPGDKTTFYICSRNTIRVYDPKDPHSEIANKYNIKEKWIKTGCKYAVQGEIYGPKIQGNPLKVKELTLAVFCVKNIIENRYWGWDEMIQVCKEWELPMVEVIERGDCFKYKTIEEWVEKSKGVYPGTDEVREGLVYRLQNDWNCNGVRASFKVINVDYLTKGQVKKGNKKQKNDKEA